MKNQNLSWLYALLLMCLFCINTHCHLFQRDEHDFQRDGILRLIDHLDDSHVVSTPFTDLLSKFIKKEDALTEKAKLFRELSTSQQRVYGATTSFSILGQSESQLPQDMEVKLNDAPIPFLNGSQSDIIQWKWIETDKVIDIQYDDNYNKGLKCLVLDVNEAFSFDAIFPDAPVELEVYVRRNWHPLDLEILINDEVIGQQAVGRDFRFISFKHSIHPGSYRIELRPLKSESLEQKRPTPPRLLIYQIRIKTKNDVILFFVPTAQQKDFVESKLETHYITDLDENGDRNPYAEIYKLKHEFTLDANDQKNNPYSIKKKIVLENLSLNVLMAPPQSCFQFPLKVPQQGILEFGAGIFVFKDSQENQTAVAKVLATFEDEDQVLFEKQLQLNPGLLRDQIQFQSIDLSALAGKKIKLTFLIEHDSGQTGEDPLDKAFMYWANPIIYQPTKNKTNVILISLDTLRADHLGSYGYKRPTSPGLDELAKDSALFENTYAQSSWTLPSHMSMLFSLNSASHQVFFNDQKIDSSIPSLATFMKDQGYVTFGLTGGGYVSSIYGFAKGFDWYDEPVGGRKAPLANDEAERLFQYTSDWLKKNQDKPFFLFLHTFQIHGPYACPPPWNTQFLDKGARFEKIGLRNFLDAHGEDYSFSREEVENIVGLYDGEIRYTDDVLISPLVALLKQLDIYDNTLLIITSDHGEEFKDHGGWLHGRTVYDELIRVPLIVKFPDSAFKGTRIPHKSRLIDIMPTILDVTDIKFSQSEIDGKSLLPMLNGKEVADRIFISDLAHKNVPDPCPALIATNKDGLKFIIKKSQDGVAGIEIYDLRRDPKERKDIFEEAKRFRTEVILFLDEYYAEKAKLNRRLQKVLLDKELEEKLKALGYLR